MISSAEKTEKNINKSKGSPLFSILIAVYNTAPYLYECLDSVLNQTFTDWEAICVNDASTDNSPEILRKYAKKDARFKIIDHEHNKNLYATRSTAIQASKGKYTAFLDSDDFLHPQFLETGKKLMESADYLLVQMGFHICGSRHTQKYPLLSETISPEDFLYGVVISSRYALSLWGSIYQTEMLKKTDIGYEQFINDGEDMLRITNLLVHSANRIRIETTEKMYNYRFGTGLHGRKKYSFQNLKNLLTYHYVCLQELKILPPQIIPAFIKKYGSPETAFSTNCFQVLVERMATKEDFKRGVKLFCDIYGPDIFIQHLADSHIAFLRCRFFHYFDHIFFFMSLVFKRIKEKIFLRK